MKFSYNWLRELSGTKKSPEQLAEILALKAFEVEGVEKIGSGLDKVIVAQILEIKKHPNADKLSLVKLAIGNSQFVDVVCGASNIKPGDIVPLALPGAKLPSGLEIKAAEIRGVKSNGMLCAEDELGLGGDHSGILILDKGLKKGKLLKDELGLEDVVIDIKVTADRGHDAMSHIGMAREICAIEGRKIKFLEARLPKKDKRGSTSLDQRGPKRSNLNVLIKDKKLCPRYIGAVMKSIKVGPSPLWMQARLRAAGVRPINNIVDATNYVMLETGQPMHAFDTDKIKKQKPKIKMAVQNEKINIIVRRAKENEEIKLLDGAVKKLNTDDLVIANEKKALALAGIMGGEDSGINENTTSIVLEAANFNARNIRKSRMRLELKTDASDRFEKELDPNLAEIAMARAIQIIQKLGGKAEEAVDVYPAKIKPWKLKLNLNYTQNLLGEKIPAKIVVKILDSLGIKTDSASDLRLGLQIPTFRLDLKTQEDLIEEIGRIYGYEKIKPQAPKVEIKMPPLAEERKFARLVKKILVGKGFSEVYNYSFYSQHNANLAMLGDIEHLELANPMNPDQALMRVSLIPGILKNVRENIKRYRDIRIFEIGKVFWPNREVLPEEKNMLAGAIHAEQKKYTKLKKQDTNFYEAKGYAEALLEMLGIGNFYFDTFEAVPADTPLGLWHESRTAAIKIEGAGETIGYIGEISPLVLVNYDIARRLAVFELDLEKLLKLAEKENEYQPIRKYPEVLRDISMIAPGGVLVDEILRTMQMAGGDLLLDADLFDIYDFDDGTSSYAFHLIFGAPDRTLENAEVDEIMRKIVNKLEKELKVKVRK